MEGDKWIAMTGRSNGRTMGGGGKRLMQKEKWVEMLEG